MDSIDEYDDYGTSNLGCMGSILTKNWILTSAKCCTYMGCDSQPAGCDPNKNRIVTGKQKVGFEDLFFSQETDHEPSQAFIHPQDSFQRSLVDRSSRSLLKIIREDRCGKSLGRKF